jgi:hypothetical protein
MLQRVGWQGRCTRITVVPIMLAAATSSLKSIAPLPSPSNPLNARPSSSLRSSTRLAATSAATIVTVCWAAGGWLSGPNSARPAIRSLDSIDPHRGSEGGSLLSIKTFEEKCEGSRPAPFEGNTADLKIELSGRDHSARMRHSMYECDGLGSC